MKKRKPYAKVCREPLIQWPAGFLNFAPKNPESYQKPGLSPSATKAGPGRRAKHGRRGKTGVKIARILKKQPASGRFA